MSDKELPKENEGEHKANEAESLDQSATQTNEDHQEESSETPIENTETVEAPEAAVEESKDTPDATESVVVETAPADPVAIEPEATQAPKVEEEVEASSSTDSTTEETDTNESDVEETSSEEESEPEEEEIDYHALGKEQLIAELNKLIATKPIQSIKNEVEEIKTEFNAKFDEELEHKKEEFLAAGGNIIDFHYTTPLKKQFNSAYFDYKEKRNSYYQNLKRDLQANYTKREELIEELKGLLNAEENINTTYKHFKDIQERWHGQSQEISTTLSGIPTAIMWRIFTISCI